MISYWLGTVGHKFDLRMWIDRIVIPMPNALKEEPLEDATHAINSLKLKL